MPRCLTVVPYLPVADLEARHRGCRTTVEGSHLHMLWLVSLGLHVPAIAQLTGYSVSWVRTVVHRYNSPGSGVASCAITGPMTPNSMAKARAVGSTARRQAVNMMSSR